MVIDPERGAVIMNKGLIKRSTAKEGEELQAYLRSMRRHSVVPSKKGKGAKYDRAKAKNSGWE